MCQSKANGGKRCPLHRRGTRAMLAALRTQHDLDRHQGDAVFRKAHTKARPRLTDPTPQEWHEFLNERIRQLALDQNLDPRDFTTVAHKLHAAKDDVPDARTYAALQELDLRAKKAASAIRRQLNSASALRGVPANEVAERFHAYRAQYLHELRALPAGERPDPPAEWVTGFTTKDMMAVSAPNDPATLYAMYRCQADPDAFDHAGRSTYASIDLETAGPSGKAGFAPENGSIIEVGIVEYDADGNETDRYSQLVAPAPEVAAACGTGCVDVHGITLADVADAPDWEAVAPAVGERLTGKVLLAQNARFEQDWLNHHLSLHGQQFNRWGPVVDTLCIARQHAPSLPNHRLATICESVGVAYTDGHRALHDADVAGKAFFALRRQITETYLSSPARANAPQPPRGAGLRHRRSQITRLTAADFDPATVEDKWATPVRAVVTAA